MPSIKQNPELEIGIKKLVKKIMISKKKVSYSWTKKVIIKSKVSGNH